MIYTDKKLYMALKKCVEVGKKLGSNTEFCMLRGMMMFYPYPVNTPKYDIDNKAIHIVFLHDKILADLKELMYLNLYVNGKEFYDMDKEYKQFFKEIEVTDRSLIIRYVQENVDESKTLDAFWLHVEENNMVIDPNDSILIAAEFASFKETYVQPVVCTTISLTIPFLNNDNDYMVKQCEIYKDEILSKEREYEERQFTQEILTQILSAKTPEQIIFNLNGTSHKLRLMKSMFTACTPKTSTVTVLSFNRDTEIMQNIIVIRQKLFTICSSYRTAIY